MCATVMSMYKALRISADSHAKLATLARAHMRSIKGELEYLIEQEFIHTSIVSVNLDGNSPVAIKAT